MQIFLATIFSLILFGGVFITSERFMNIENDAKAYFIGVTVILLLLVCSITRKGLSRLNVALHSQGISIGFATICLMLSVYGLFQYFGIEKSGHYAFPITGTYENPAGFAAVQAAMFPFAFILCFDRERTNITRLFAVTVSTLCIITVILSGSRTGVRAICAGSMVVIVFKTKVLSLFKAYRWLWIPLVVVTVAALILLYQVKASSADGRLFIWKICMDMIADSPLIGYGMGGFHKHYMNAQATYFSLYPNSPYVMLADNITHPFNEYIKLIVNYGIVGLAVAITLLVWIVRKLFKSDSRTKVIGLAVTASIFILCQFSYPFHYAAVWLIAGIAIIPAFIQPKAEEKAIVTPRYIRISFPILFTVLLVGICRMMYLDMKWAEMSKRSLAGQTERMLPYYEKMKPQMKHNPLFLYNYAAELNYIGRHEESLVITEECMKLYNDYDVQFLLADNLANTDNIDQAIETYRYAGNMIPCRFEPLDGMMTLYLGSGDTLNAVRIAREIVAKPVKVPSSRVNVIVAAAKQLIE